MDMVKIYVMTCHDNCYLKIKGYIFMRNNLGIKVSLYK